MKLEVMRLLGMSMTHTWLDPKSHKMVREESFSIESISLEGAKSRCPMVVIEGLADEAEIPLEFLEDLINLSHADCYSQDLRYIEVFEVEE